VTGACVSGAQGAWSGAPLQVWQNGRLYPSGWALYPDPDAYPE
jgi:hypothetical protein